MNKSRDHAAQACGCWDGNYALDIKSAWTANRLVGAEIMRRMTGTSKFWLNWAFEDYLAFRPNRVLSIGCGDGAHELIIARNRYAGSIHAFDASEVGITKARSAAAAEALAIEFSVETFEDFQKRPVDAAYDFVMFTGSLHHVRDLEGMLEKVRQLLTPDGVVMFNEYVGPAYNIYGTEQLRIVNQMLSALAPDFRLPTNPTLVNPTIDAVMAADPTEAVRAPLIPTLLEAYFELESIRYFGGALLHPIFSCLNARRLNDGSPESDSIVRLLINVENALMQGGVLGSDFAFGFCRQRAR